MDELYLRFFKEACAVGGWAQQCLVFEKLCEAYNTPPRAYHNLKHVRYVLDTFDTVREFCDAPENVAMALWIHDAVYNPLSKTNEEESAHLGEQLLGQLRVHPARIDEISTLVLATKEGQSLLTNDEEMMYDIDRHILAASPKLFSATSDLIYKEFAPHCSRKTYYEGRLAFFDDLMRNGRIFRSETFYDSYEEQAQNNVKKEMTRLKSLLQAGF